MLVQGCMKKLNEWVLVILHRIKNGILIDYLDSTQDLLLGLKQVKGFSFQINLKNLNEVNQKRKYNFLNACLNKYFKFNESQFEQTP